VRGRREGRQKRAGKRGGTERILTHHPTTQEEDKEFNHPSYLKGNPYWDLRARPIALSSERAGNPYRITHTAQSTKT
jgi:hypothetical protein